MSSSHNDLATWAGKARRQGRNTIEITVDLADEVSDVIVDQANRIMDLEHERRMAEAMTSEQAPTAGIEAETLRELNQILVRDDRSDILHLDPVIRKGIQAALVAIAALEDQVRSARADAWREGRDAAAKIADAHANHYDGTRDIDVAVQNATKDAEAIEIADAIRVLNPPESSNAAS